MRALSSTAGPLIILNLFTLYSHYLFLLRYMTDKEPSYWLMKSEPDAYSIDTLKNDGVTLWDGIRNYQARNFMRKMNKGDKIFFYHSNCKPPGIVGLMEVTDLNVVDPTQFDKDSKYFDPKSKPDNPRWDLSLIHI